MNPSGGMRYSEILKQLDKLNLSSHQSEKTRRVAECCWLNKALSPKMRSERRRCSRLLRYSPYSLDLPLTDFFPRCPRPSGNFFSAPAVKFELENPSASKTSSNEIPDRSKNAKAFVDRMDDSAQCRNVTGAFDTYGAQLRVCSHLWDRDDVAGLLPFSLLSRRLTSAAACLAKTAAPSSTAGASWVASCSFQARSQPAVEQPQSHGTSNNGPGNALTMGELAAYLDEFLYLPKKMSAMAENMYN